MSLRSYIFCIGFGNNKKSCPGKYWCCNYTAIIIFSNSKNKLQMWSTTQFLDSGLVITFLIISTKIQKWLEKISYNYFYKDILRFLSRRRMYWILNELRKWIGLLSAIILKNCNRFLIEMDLNGKLQNIYNMTTQPFSSSAGHRPPSSLFNPFDVVL